MPTMSPPERTHLTQEQRRAHILSLLRRDGVVRIATLARTFDVATETARRDLDELAEAGELQRTLRRRRQPFAHRRAGHRPSRPRAPRGAHRASPPPRPPWSGTATR
jgi:predicted ArsR family transcriptional regulator